jgi:medium-chain acyl-[acyl-carrier-protein] hydrolase
MTLDRWVPFRNEGAVVRRRVFCFPHAGGTAAFYRPLRSCMPPEIDFCPVELPGRAARFGEAPLSTMRALFEQLTDVLKPLMAVPFAFFGHSVGSCIAYEAARQLRSADQRSAVHLFVSGRGSPPAASADHRPARPRSDQELLAILDEFGGTPVAVMQCPELVAALLPALRADLELVEGYGIDPGDRIGCPISAFGGADDLARSGSLQSWGSLTRGQFRTRVFPGGHFYFSAAPAALAREIIQDLFACETASDAGQGK